MAEAASPEERSRINSSEQEEREAARAETPLRIHALVDIGDFLLGFTIEADSGAHEARVRLFSLHTRAWLAGAVPILPTKEHGEGLPVDGRWSMQLVGQDSIVVIYSNPSRCRLIYLHVDRRPTKHFPLSLFVVRSRDIRPTLPALSGAFNCDVLYECAPDGSAERVTIVTDDYLFDRDSVRAHEDEGGRIVQFAYVNMINSVLSIILSRCRQTGSLLLTRTKDAVAHEELPDAKAVGVLIDRETGGESLVAIGVQPEGAEAPSFKSKVSSFLVDGVTLAVDRRGVLWSLNATTRVWSTLPVASFPHDDISSLTLTAGGRVLCVGQRALTNSSVPAFLIVDYMFRPLWRFLQPTSLKEAAQTSVCRRLRMDGDETDLSGMSEYRRGYDATVSFVIGLGPERQPGPSTGPTRAHQGPAQ